MGEFQVFDDVFAPDKEPEFKYTGANPFSMIKKALDVFRRTYEISGTKFTQKDTRYDFSGEVRKFFIDTEMLREEDGFTDCWVNIRFQGEQHSETKMGWLRIIIYAQLRTAFKEDNFLQKIFNFIYLHLFYKRHRMELLKRNNERGRMAFNQVREMFKLPVRPETV